jgi:hypothetical protein
MLRSFDHVPKCPPKVEPSLGVWELYTHRKWKVSQVGAPIFVLSRFAFRRHVLEGRARSMPGVASLDFMLANFRDRRS